MLHIRDVHTVQQPHTIEFIQQTNHSHRVCTHFIFENLLNECAVRHRVRVRVRVVAVEKHA